MIKLTIYTADCTHSLSNCIYPNKHIITDETSMIKAMKCDHVTAEYKDNYRSNSNFISADNVPLDCDNDHSDNPDDWITPFEVAMAFPDVAFVAVYSKSHMKVKDGRSARPRFHVYFSIPKMTDSREYTLLKKRIVSSFPYFDSNALDSARLLFGVAEPQVEFYDGSNNIVDYLDDKDFESWDNQQSEIPQGKRNSTMSHYAGRIIKRYGDTDEAYKLYLQKADKCNPPLADEELKIIWNSALKFGEKVSSQAGYIPPEQYNANLKLKPEDYSDVGQAVVLAREYNESLRYSPSTGYLVYNGSFWEESDPLSQAVAQELTTRQLAEAETEINKRLKEMEQNGAFEILAQMGAKKAVSAFNKLQAHSYEMYEDALIYKKYAIKRRDSKYISSALKEVRPMVCITQDLLDKNEFLLNTPSGTYDLRKGTDEIQEHNNFDYITKQTAVNADVLTVGCKRNVKPELAEAKGKRLLIAAELEEGMRLNTSNVKQLCSTDEIYAEKKYKAPFSYIPSHTLVLYTNHLPKVGAIDKGTWRRLIVIPFEAKIEGSNDVKNYADYLFDNAGGAVLSWIIEGAKKVIEENYHIEPPKKVKDAIRKYKENNDWMSHFLSECCEVDESYTAKSGEVYNAYRSYCTQVCDFIRSTADFYTALESSGFDRKKTRDCNLIIGLRLKSEFLE